MKNQVRFPLMIDERVIKMARALQGLCGHKSLSEYVRQAVIEKNQREAVRLSRENLPQPE